jgi:hypothetical protein
VDALASGGDEGRGRLRKASDRCEQPVTRRFPNGETHPAVRRDISSLWGEKLTRRSETSQ